MRDVGTDIVDARATPRGIVAIDQRGRVTGARRGDTAIDWRSAPRRVVTPTQGYVEAPTNVVLDPTGGYAAAVFDGHGVCVVPIGGRVVEGVKFARFGIEAEAGATRVVLGPSADVVAFTYRTHGPDVGVGRGWIAVDLRSQKMLDGDWTRRARVQGHMALDLDGAGRCVVLASPEPDGVVGAFRIGGAGERVSTPPLGATLAAIDRKGVLAAYVYPARPQLRVDSLELDGDGATIAITDSHRIDPQVRDVVGVAFDDDSRRIACVGADGTLEVVPVP